MKKEIFVKLVDCGFGQRNILAYVNLPKKYIENVDRRSGELELNAAGAEFAEKATGEVWGRWNHTACFPVTEEEIEELENKKREIEFILQVYKNCK